MITLKIRSVLLVLISISNCPTILSESIAKSLLKSMSHLIIRIETQQRQKTIEWIRSTAQKHQSKRLAACTSLHMIEELLRSDEQRALKKIQKTFNIPEEVMQDYCARMKIIKDDAINICYKTPLENIVHDSTIPEYIMVQIKNSLENVGINPQAVNIVRDAGYFAVNTGQAAYTRDPYTYDHWRGQNYFKQGATMFGVNLKTLTKISPYIIAHEIVHLLEAHTAQRNELLFMIKKHNAFFSVQTIEQHPDVMRLFRIHEKMGYLLPVIHHPEMILYALDFYLIPMKEVVLYNYPIRSILRWSISPAHWIHPCAEEMLPWILKMEEIIHNQQKIVA